MQSIRMPPTLMKNTGVQHIPFIKKPLVNKQVVSYYYAPQRKNINTLPLGMSISDKYKIPDHWSYSNHTQAKTFTQNDWAIYAAHMCLINFHRNKSNPLIIIEKGLSCGFSTSNAAVVHAYEALEKKIDEKKRIRFSDFYNITRMWSADILKYVVM
jgi:hypothetical protein